MHDGRKKAKTFPEDWEQSNFCAGAALFCSRVLSVPDNFLFPCCVAVAEFPRAMSLHLPHTLFWTKICKLSLSSTEKAICQAARY